MDGEKTKSTAFFSRLAAGITPYTAGEQPNGRQFVKLNTNEIPIRPLRRCMRRSKISTR